MKAVHITAFGGVENLQVVDVPKPEPQAGEVLVRVVNCGINPVDRSQLVGRWPWLQLPHTPGSEIAGTVDQLGPGVQGVQEGERVAASFRIACGRCHYCAMGREEACNADPRSKSAPIMVGLPSEGGWAEYVVVPARNLVRLPPDMSFEAGCAAALDGLTAWHQVDRAGVQVGHHVLVTAATGGIGTFAIQIARQRGAEVYAVTGRSQMASRLRELGAAQVIDRSVEDVAARALQLTNGRGVDIVLDSTGAANLATNLAALGPLGKMVYCGILTGFDAHFNMATFYAQQLSIIGSTAGSVLDLARLIDSMALGHVTPAIWKTFGITDIQHAVREVDAAGRFGKVLLAFA